MVCDTHEPLVFREPPEASDSMKTGGREGYMDQKASISCRAGYSAATMKRFRTGSASTGREIIAQLLDIKTSAICYNYYVVLYNMQYITINYIVIVTYYMCLNQDAGHKANLTSGLCVPERIPAPADYSVPLYRD